MIKGEKVRFDVHNILYSIFKLNKNLKDPYIKKIRITGIIFFWSHNSFEMEKYSLKFKKIYVHQHTQHLMSLSYHTSNFSCFCKHR